MSFKKKGLKYAIYSRKRAHRIHDMACNSVGLEFALRVFLACRRFHYLGHWPQIIQLTALVRQGAKLDSSRSRVIESRTRLRRQSVLERQIFQPLAA